VPGNKSPETPRPHKKIFNWHILKYFYQIPRWWLEGGSRKHASYSEILERRWRHTLQAKPPRTGKTLIPPHLQPAQRISTSHTNQEGPWASTHQCPDGLGRHRQVLFYFMRPLWWDNYRTTFEALYPGLEAEMDTKISKTKTLLHLNLEVFFFNFLFFILFYFILFLYMYIYFSFIYLFFIFILVFILFIFYFQSNLCLSNTCSAYCQLVH
jgi:hypothetical protein